jgi:hypothetical protein
MLPAATQKSGADPELKAVAAAEASTAVKEAEGETLMAAAGGKLATEEQRVAGSAVAETLPAAAEMVAAVAGEKLATEEQQMAGSAVAETSTAAVEMVAAAVEGNSTAAAGTIAAVAAGNSIAAERKPMPGKAAVPPLL